MKTYTFKLPKNNNSADIYKEKLMKRVINAYPWLTVESNYDYPKCDFGVEYAGAGDYITLGLSKTVQTVRLSVLLTVVLTLIWRKSSSVQ